MPHLGSPGGLAAAAWGDGGLDQIPPSDILDLQRVAGNDAVARLIGGSGSTPGAAGHAGEAIQRQPPSAAPMPTATPTPAAGPPPAAGAASAGPTASDADKQLLEDEDKAAKALGAKIGAQALYVWLEDPVDAMARKGRAPETEVLSVTNILSRNAGDPVRKSFDTPGPAAAFGASNGGNAIVIKQDRFFFTATLGSSANFVPEKVWKVKPYFPVAAAIGANGFSFPLNIELVRPDQNQGSAAGFTDPHRAEPPDASSMRALAGVKSAEDLAKETEEANKARAEGRAPAEPKAAEKGQIPPEKQEAFIETYFRARAMEVLSDNQALVEKLEKDFAPTGSGGAEKGVSKSAQTLIDSTKKYGQPFQQLLEHEALAEKFYQLVTQRISFRLGATKIKVAGQEMLAVEAKYQLDKQIKELKQEKDEVLSQMPMLALMVGQDREAPGESSTAGKALYGAGGGLTVAWENLQMAWKDDVDKPTLYGRNQYDASSFGKGASDEDLRKEFLEKITGVKTAIREAKARTISEGPGFLYGLKSLRMRVQGDLATNPDMKKKLDEILAAKEIKDTIINVGLMAFQIGLFFVPGGQLLSAAIGVGQSAYELQKGLKEWDYGKAAVDPTKALVDQQEKADEVFWGAVFLAASAADFGGSVVGVATKGEKSLTEAEQMAKKMGAKPYAKPKPKKLLGEAEEDPFKRPKDVPPGVLAPVSITKPEAGALSDAAKAAFESIGVSFSKKGVAENLGDGFAMLSAAKGSWSRIKSVCLTGLASPADKAMGKYIMENMLAYRQKTTYGLLDKLVKETDALRGTKHEIEAVGSTNLTSDLDFSVKGPHAGEVIEKFNAQFRGQFKDVESAVAFDTNIYSNPAFFESQAHLAVDGKKIVVGLDPTDAKAVAGGGPKAWETFKAQARKGAVGAEGAGKDTARIEGILSEAEKLYPKDLGSRIAHVNNFQQEAAAHMKAADTMLAEGPAGMAKWQKYKESILSSAPAGNRDHLRAVFAEAEARTISYQDEVLLEINKGRPKDKQITRDQLSEMSHGAEGDAAKQQAYGDYMRARTTIYERKLGKVAAKQKEYEALKPRYLELKAKFDAGGLGKAEELELMQAHSKMMALGADIGGAQSEALYFAAEAYQTEGSLLMVVQNAQKAKGLLSSPHYGAVLASKARDACFENLGYVMVHSGGGLDEAVKAGKYLERASFGYRAHPLATGKGPGVMGLVGEVLAAKSAGEAVQIEKIVARYGPPKEAAIKKFMAEIQTAGGQIRGNMAKVSGQPIPTVEAAWIKAVDTGHAGTLVQYAAAAGGKAGSVSVATRE